MRRLIRLAKQNAWIELIAMIEADPWGTPYRLVLGKLRNTTPRLTETLEEDKMDELIDTLFPGGRLRDGASRDITGEWRERWKVSAAEVQVIMKKRGTKNRAPGINGFMATAWKKVPNAVMGGIAKCFTACLKEGIFPVEWKGAILVLIPKSNSPAGPMPKARPICLLNEIGKVLEKVLAERMTSWMNENPRCNLADNQYGFREGRSTCDAILRVQQLATGSIREGKYVMGVSLDIKNAFNSIPWTRILDAPERNGFPSYIRRIIAAYLSERWIEYGVRGGETRKRAVRAGVPQGSVLGPLLWNITYDAVLRSETEDGCALTCYAYDTFITVTADNVKLAVARANLQAARTIRCIEQLGLEVAAAKTEAILFYGPRRRPSVMPEVTIGDVDVRVGDSIKCLGIMLDSKWSFTQHFEYVADKASRVARSLGRLMPNLRGPREAKRRLYATVVSSVLLYGAPVWCDSPASSTVKQRAQLPIKRVQRYTALRVIAAYRTVSYEAATILARTPPLYLVAALQKRIFTRIREAKRSRVWTPRTDNEIRAMERVLFKRQWEIHLRQPNMSGVRVREAISPRFSDWVERRKGGLSFHLTQLITGHGCFNDYLKWIGKRDSNQCDQCGEGEDTAQHNLEDYAAWSIQRAELTRIIGGDLTLTAVIGAILGSEEAWRAVNIYATDIMRRKEEAERQKEELERALQAVADGTPAANLIASPNRDGSPNSSSGS